MGLSLAKPGEVIDAWSSWNDQENPSMVLRTEHMEVMRLHLNPGVHIPTHEAQGEIIVMCVGGRVALTALNERYELSNGQMLYLLIHEPFDLYGIEEASLLLTILRPLPGQADLIGENP